VEVSPGISGKQRASTLASSWYQLVLGESNVNGNSFQSQGPVPLARCGYCNHNGLTYPPCTAEIFPGKIDLAKGSSTDLQATCTW